MKLFRTWFIGMSYVIVGLEAFSAGTVLHHRWFFDMTLSIVIAVFWAGIGLLMSHSAYTEGRIDSDMEHLERFGEMLKQLIEAEEQLTKFKAEKQPKVASKPAKG